MPLPFSLCQCHPLIPSDSKPPLRNVRVLMLWLGNGQTGWPEGRDLATAAECLVQSIQATCIHMYAIPATRSHPSACPGLPPIQNRHWGGSLYQNFNYKSRCWELDTLDSGTVYEGAYWMSFLVQAMWQEVTMNATTIALLIRTSGGSEWMLKV